MGTSNLQEAARALGLAGRGSAGTFYGEVEGFPVQLAARLPYRSDQVLALIRYDAEGRAQDVAKALAESLPHLALLGIAASDLSSDADSVVLTFPASVLLSKKRDVIEARVRAVLDVLKNAVPDNRKACWKCGASRGEPVLLEGEVDRICVDCIEAFEHQTGVADHVYDAYAANLPMALVAALVAGALGAALYGGVIIATDTMHAWLAIVTGGCVGCAAANGAGKATPAVRAIAAVITIVSVLAGLLGYIGFRLSAQAEARGRVFDWVAFLQAAPKVLVATAWETAFSLAVGVIAALYAMRWIRR